MFINTTPNEKSTGDSYASVDTINDLDFPTTHREGKAFASMRAAFALKGHSLRCTDPADGPVTYWVERWGQIRYLHSLDEVAMFLGHIGGRV